MHALYPHFKGRTSVAYHESGKYIFTTGENMLIRRFRAKSSDEPDVFDLESKTGRSISARASRFAVAYDDGSAELFDSESFQSIGALSRSTLPLHSIAFSADGQYIAIIGDDCSKIVRTLDITDVKTIDGDVKHIAFHPAKPHLVCVSDLKGLVRVLDLNTGSTVASIDAVIPSLSSLNDDRTTAAAWRACGSVLALPTKTFDIALIKTGDWQPYTRLQGHQNALTALEWSPNGKYIASASRDGTVRLWDADSKRELRKVEIQNPLELKWNPVQNEISVSTDKGQLYVVSDFVPRDYDLPIGDLVQLDPGQPESEENLFVSELFDDSELVDAVTSPEERPERRRRPSLEIAAKKPKLNFAIGLQQPFQPGSTPWTSSKRYLCMSHLGYVWSTRQSHDHHTVTVTFFDQSVHRESSFHDPDKFDLAALSADATALADSRSGKVAVRFHSAKNDNWEIELNKLDQGVCSIALSRSVLAVFTKNGFLRVYTLYGTPLGVSRVGGSAGAVIASAAFETDVFYIQQSSERSYSYTFENVEQAKYYQKQDALEISPNSSLVALFFSEEGNACIMDSAQILSTLVHSRSFGQARWVPVFSDPNPDPELKTTYWPLGVFENKFACILLKGKKTTPGFPLPVTDEFDLQVPGLHGFESQYLVGKTLFLQLRDKIESAETNETSETNEVLEDQSLELDKAMLRQFQESCEAQKINKCLQIVQLFATEDSLRAAAQIASAYKLTQIAEQILESLD